MKTGTLMNDILLPLAALVLLAILGYRPLRRDLHEARYFAAQRRALLHPYEDREWHRRYAERNGLAWSPCPVCGEGFGGHEALGKSIPHPDPAKAARGVRLMLCPQCSISRRAPKLTPQVQKSLKNHKTPKKK